MVQYNNYELGSGPDLLYTVNGEACDWMYGVHDIFAYTPEIGGQSDGFWPATNRIFPLAEENLYPNQVLAINSGSKYDVQIHLDSNSFMQGESYPLYISIMNRGLGQSNGDVKINIISSENLFFELDYFEIGNFEPREQLDLGGITYFEINSNLLGASSEEITVEVYDDDGFVYDSYVQLLVGETILIDYEDFESESSWTVGDSDDTATAGLWDRLIPIGTYENNELVQPDEDHTEDGDYCYLTQNPSDLGSNPGSNDVDGGKTTLFSPMYDLSIYDGAVVSYWRWYSNNQGNNPGSDIWQVDVTFDNGYSWFELENTNIANNSWEKHQYLLNDYIDLLSDSVRFRFIAEDIFNDGDNGSGGSLIEAAVDDFMLEGFVYDDILLGDVNYDGDINVSDIVIVVNMILGGGGVDFSADLNQDEIIDVLDIVLLIDIILG